MTVIPHPRRGTGQRPSTVVCVCITSTRSIIFSSLSVALAFVVVALVVLQPLTLSSPSPYSQVSRDGVDYTFQPMLRPRTSTVQNETPLVLEKAREQKEDSFDFAFDPSTSLPYAVFYNIYLKPNSAKEPDITTKGIAIVEEQIGQIGESFAALLKNEKQQQLTVYYNTVGAAPLNATLVNGLCEPHNLDCRHLRHYESGFEEVTLQAVHSFCQAHQDDDSLRVIYLHNKGSYTDSGFNTFWRRHLTMAATSQLCLQPSNSTCNVCGLQFWPMWSNFFPGNMWTAKCSYVQKLLPPVGFSNVTRQLKDKVSQLERDGTLQMSLFPPEKFPSEPDRYMLDRFAAEHWIGAHPSLQPCDLSEQADISMWYLQRNRSSLHDFSFAMAPRKPLRAPLKFWPLMRDMKRHKVKVLNDPVARIKEYFLLPGYIFKWVTLYQELPSRSSWVWDWFPDGALWRDCVATHGINIIDAVLLNQTFTMTT